MLSIKEEEIGKLTSIKLQGILHELEGQCNWLRTRCTQYAGELALKEFFIVEKDIVIKSLKEKLNNQE